MGTSIDLLKMLEPSVRPAGAGGPSKAAGKPPLEAQSFESLLEAAQGLPDGDEADSTAAGVTDAKPKKCNPLGSLGGMDRIENESLRQLIAGAGDAAGAKSNEAGLNN
jgi:hypothetical protein